MGFGIFAFEVLPMGDDFATWQSVVDDFSTIVHWPSIVHVAVRLVVAAVLGGLLGYQREKSGKAAGLRTHILIAVGAAFFIVVPTAIQMPTGDMARIIQGLVTGIGFLGGGAILKLTDEKRIQGLTTAAGIWMTAAVGMAAGIGQFGAALVAAILGLVILELLYRIETATGMDHEGE
jgi:putative Mg2+ transporter-C (MgtC) family protein